MNIYIAGKVTGLPWADVECKFKRSEDIVSKLGHVPVNPVRVIPKSATHQEAMRICIPLLLSCQGILLQDDWSDSKGAVIENTVAEATGMFKVTEHMAAKLVDGFSCKVNSIKNMNTQGKLERLAGLVSTIFAVDYGKFRSCKRISQEYQDARHVFCKVAYEQWSVQYKLIGEFMDGRHHSTILDSVRKANDLIFTVDYIAKAYNMIINELNRWEVAA